MILGACSAFFFAHGSIVYEGVYGLQMNVIAMLMLVVANFHDSADGQLARMTGKTTQLGRILDGAASNVWFVPIYTALTYRFYCYHSHEFRFLGLDDTPATEAVATSAFFVLALVSGVGCHAGQCRLADYYRQIHLLFLKGEAGSELDNSRRQREIYDSTPWKGDIINKVFLKAYVGYTAKQEKSTPQCQRFLTQLRNRYADSTAIPSDIKEEFLRGSRPLMKYTNILTFNCRALTLYATCLIDMPWLYLLIEIVGFGLLRMHMRHRHETLCQRMTQKMISRAQTPADA